MRLLPTLSSARGGPGYGGVNNMGERSPIQVNYRCISARGAPVGDDVSTGDNQDSRTLESGAKQSAPGAYR
jgi:hypothetical protein